eukprot:m.656871 g.656871  ORF g.656871 m.656871 type:complete len:50 (-) comp58434_c0_seq7:1016-1165(-)
MTSGERVSEFSRLKPEQPGGESNSTPPPDWPTAGLPSSYLLPFELISFR